MARPNKPWYWKARKQWYVRIKGQTHNLGPDRQAAFDEFYKLMASPHKPLPSDTMAVILDDFLTWCESNRAPSTYDGYKNFLQSFTLMYGRMKVSDLHAGHVTEWLNANSPENVKPKKGDKRTGWSATTKHNAITAIQRALNWATKNRGLRVNPIRGMEKPKPNRRKSIVTPTDFDALLACLKEGDPFRDLIIVSYDCGARPFEVKDLEARHIELDKQRAVIPEHEAKKNIPRAFYFPTRRSMAIIRQLTKDKPQGRLFLTKRGTPWNRFNVRCRFQRLEDKLGKRIKHYDFRRGFITRKLLSGVDSHVVARLSGHQSTKMIDQTYSVIADDHKFMLDKAKSGEDA